MKWKKNQLGGRKAVGQATCLLIWHKKWRLSALPKDLVKWFIFLWPYPIGSAANVMNNYFVAVYDVETVHVTVADPEVRWVETNSPSPRVIV